MDPLPKYKADAAFVSLGNKDPQPFVRGDSRYSPSGPQGSRLVLSERLFDLSSNIPSESNGLSISSSLNVIVSSGAALGSPP